MPSADIIVKLKLLVCFVENNCKFGKNFDAY